MNLPSPPNVSKVLSIADADEAFLTILRYLSSFRNNISAAFVTTLATWTPGVVATGGFVSATVTLRNASPPAPCAVGFTQSLPAGMLLAAVLTGPETATVTLYNFTGAPQTIPLGTLQVTALPIT